MLPGKKLRIDYHLLALANLEEPSTDKQSNSNGHEIRKYLIIHHIPDKEISSVSAPEEWAGNSASCADVQVLHAG